mmetsp:Transcript_16678/g.35057  ORF Transcript_16678/g.35057 Transcript_16678/m.35057 type:complete len:279 (-) Transcript_16678:307-1143(-)
MAASRSCPMSPATAAVKNSKVSERSRRSLSFSPFSSSCSPYKYRLSVSERDRFPKTAAWMESSVLLRFLPLELVSDSVALPSSFVLMLIALPVHASSGSFGEAAPLKEEFPRSESANDSDLVRYLLPVIIASLLGSPIVVALLAVASPCFFFSGGGIDLDAEEGASCSGSANDNDLVLYRFLNGPCTGGRDTGCTSDDWLLALDIFFFLGVFPNATPLFIPLLGTLLVSLSDISPTRLLLVDVSWFCKSISTFLEITVVDLSFSVGLVGVFVTFTGLG